MSEQTRKLNNVLNKIYDIERDVLAINNLLTWDEQGGEFGKGVDKVFDALVELNRLCQASLNAEVAKLPEKVISEYWWDACFNDPILHDEDEWDGKYKTYGDMWLGEGYVKGA